MRLSNDAFSLVASWTQWDLVIEKAVDRSGIRMILWRSFQVYAC